MSISERRSPSLESIATSLSSFGENPETSPSIPNIMIPQVQGASQGDSVVNWIQGELKDWLHERARIRETVPSRDDEHLKSVEASHAATDTYPMHEHFCFPADNIYFLVNGVLYSVHRYFFERDSSSFAGQGLSRREPMVLVDISTRDFDLFLSILYPSSFGLYSASTVDEWSRILRLADKWSFESIRALAITQLAPIASPVDKIVLGRRYGVNAWLPDAYGTVCVRFAALTLDEGRRLGVDDVIRINAIRQEFCFVPVPASSLAPLSEVQEQVESRFGLTIQTPPSAPVEPLSGAEELGPNGKPLSKVMRRKRQKEREAKEEADKAARAREDAEKPAEERAAEEPRTASVFEPQRTAADQHSEVTHEKAAEEERSAEEPRMASIFEPQRTAADQHSEVAHEKTAEQERAAEEPRIASTFELEPTAADAAPKLSKVAQRRKDKAEKAARAAEEAACAGEAEVPYTTPDLHCT